MITASGDTFAHRELLKALGGQWDAKARCWTFYHLSDSDLLRLRSLARVLVTVHDIKPAPPWRPELPEPVKPTTFKRGPTRFIGNDPSLVGTFKDEDPIVFFGFDSLNAFTNYVERLERPTNCGDGRHDPSWRTSEKRNNWAGTPNMETAIKLAREGWTDGFGIADIFDLPPATRKHRRASHAGGSVSVGKLLAGQPKHMIRRSMQPKHRRISLFVESVMSRHVTAENAMLRALLIGSIIDQVEQQDYICDVYAVGASLSYHDHGPCSHLAVQIKHSGERLNLLDIMFALGHPSFSRRMYFACEGDLPEIDIHPSRIGYVSEAFNGEDMPYPDWYYFRQIFAQNQYLYKVDPFAMVDHIVPDNFPIEIKGRNK